MAAAVRQCHVAQRTTVCHLLPTTRRRNNPNTKQTRRDGARCCALELQAPSSVPRSPGAALACLRQQAARQRGKVEEPPRQQALNGGLEGHTHTRWPVGQDIAPLLERVHSWRDAQLRLGSSTALEREGELRKGIASQSKAAKRREREQLIAGGKRVVEQRPIQPGGPGPLGAAPAGAARPAAFQSLRGPPYCSDGVDHVGCVIDSSCSRVGQGRDEGISRAEGGGGNLLAAGGRLL